MATLDLTGATVTVGGVDVSGYVTMRPGVYEVTLPHSTTVHLGMISVGFDPDPWQEQAMVSTFAGRPDFTMRFRGTVDAIPARGYRTLMGRQHPRVTRMHAAYGRRRGRGRW